MTDEDTTELAALFGVTFNMAYGGVSIPADHNYYRQYIALAEGRTPEVTGSPYWD